MNDDVIKSWTPRELIREVYHELNQRSNLAQGFMTLLLDKENSSYFDSNPEKNEEFLMRIQDEINAICEVNRWLRVWQSNNNDS